MRTGTSLSSASDWKFFSANLYSMVGSLLLCARYGELRRLVFGITNTMLAGSLRELEADGLVARTQYPEMPVRVEYSLTEKARSLIPILMELRDWGDANL